MENLNYTVKIKRAAKGGFWAEVPALPGCFTQGQTLEEIMAMVKEAIECQLSSLLNRGKPLPVEKPSKGGFVFPVTVCAPRMP